MENEKKKKKGILATIWESMTKTGGCCGPGESCCGPSDSGAPESRAKNPTESSQQPEK